MICNLWTCSIFVFSWETCFDISWFDLSLWNLYSWNFWDVQTRISWLSFLLVELQMNHVTVSLLQAGSCHLLDLMTHCLKCHHLWFGENVKSRQQRSKTPVQRCAPGGHMGCWIVSNAVMNPHALGVDDSFKHWNCTVPLLPFGLNTGNLWNFESTIISHKAIYRIPESSVAWIYKYGISQHQNCGMHLWLVRNIYTGVQCLWIVFWLHRLGYCDIGTISQWRASQVPIRRHALRHLKLCQM